jgi:predicted nucleotidyltransferase component of viral defense system
LGIGDPVTPGPQKKKTPSLLSGNDEISWSVYPIETICAEKLHALISHGDQNSRSKDVHDLAIFLSKVDGSTLKEALKRSFGFRSTDLPKSFQTEIKNINTDWLERGWASAVDSIPNAMSFKTAFEKVVKLIGEIEAS